MYGKFNKYKANNNNITLFANIFGDTYLAKIDTSGVTDMSNLFRYKHGYHGGGISDWDVSNVIDMETMFYTEPLLIKILALGFLFLVVIIIIFLLGLKYLASH